MIVLDTNVVSELLRPMPWLPVVNCVGSTGAEVLVTAIAVAELARGIDILPVGRRREALQVRIREALASLGSHILTFTEADGWTYGAVIEAPSHGPADLGGGRDDRRLLPDSGRPPADPPHLGLRGTGPSPSRSLAHRRAYGVSRRSSCVLEIVASERGSFFYTRNTGSQAGERPRPPDGQWGERR